MLFRRENTLKFIGAAVFIVIYFTVWRWIRVLLITWVFIPGAEFTAEKYDSSITVFEGNSSVNIRIIRMDMLEQMIQNQRVISDTSSPVRSQGVIPVNTKYEFFLKAPGDIWLLIAGIGIIALTGRVHHILYLWGFHIVISLISFGFLLISQVGWVPGLYIMNMISSFVIPTISMMFVVIHWKRFQL